MIEIKDADLAYAIQTYRENQDSSGIHFKINGHHSIRWHDNNNSLPPEIFPCDFPRSLDKYNTPPIRTKATKLKQVVESEKCIIIVYYDELSAYLNDTNNANNHFTSIPLVTWKIASH